MYFSIEYDQDADLSWLDQPEFKDENPADFVTLELVAYDDDGKLVNSLSNISFIEAKDDWTVGRFDTVEEIPAHCAYLREIAQGMLDEANRTVAARYLSLL